MEPSRPGERGSGDGARRPVRGDYQRSPFGERDEINPARIKSIRNEISHTNVENSGRRKPDFNNSIDGRDSKLQREKYTSHGSNATANPHNDLIDILQRFAEQITTQATLKMREDQARKTWEQMSSEFEKGGPHHSNFPAVAEFQKARKDKAHKELDGISKRLKEKQGQVTITISAIASRLLPTNSDRETDVEAYRELKYRVDDLEGNYRQQRTDMAIFQTQHANSTPERERSIDKLEPRLIVIERDLSRLNEELIAASQKWSKAVSEHSTQIQDLERSISTTFEQKLSKSLLEINQRIHHQEQLISIIHETYSTKVQPDLAKLEKFELLVQQFQHDLNIQTSNNEGVDEDMSILVNRVEAMDKKVKAMEDRRPSVSSGQRTENHMSSAYLAQSTEVVSLKAEVSELKAAQDAADTAYGQLIQGLQDRCVKLETDLTLLQQRQKDDRNQAESRLTQTDQTLAIGMSQLKSDFNMFTAVQSNSLSAMQATVSASNTSDGRPLANVEKELAPLRQDLGVLKNHVDSCLMSYQHLESRMNNLSTDQLARQMLGQLEVVYPNLRNVENALNSMRKAVSVQETELQRLNQECAKLREQTNSDGASQSLRGEVDTLRRNIENLKDAVESRSAGLKDALAKNDSQYEELRDRLDILPATPNVSAQMSALNDATDTYQKAFAMNSATPKASNGTAQKKRKRHGGFIEDSDDDDTAAVEEHSMSHS